jgi:hypothetical protein
LSTGFYSLPIGICSDRRGQHVQRDLLREGRVGRAVHLAGAPRKCPEKRAEQPVAAAKRPLTRTTGSSTLGRVRLNRLSVEDSRENIANLESAGVIDDCLKHVD